MLSVRDHYDTVLGVDRLPDLAAKLVRRDIHESRLWPGVAVSCRTPPRGGRLRWAFVITGLSLLSWATTARAECAWVFWPEAGNVRTHESSSRPVSGWATREVCEALTQKLASDSEKNTDMEKDTDMEVTVDRHTRKSTEQTDVAREEGLVPAAARRR